MRENRTKFTSNSFSKKKRVENNWNWNWMSTGHSEYLNWEFSGRKNNYSLSAISAKYKNIHVWAPPSTKPPKNREIAKCNGYVPNIKNSQLTWKSIGKRFKKNIAFYLSARRKWSGQFCWVGHGYCSPIVEIQLKRSYALFQWLLQ